jgi:predicted nuclease of predicted toxin-antitoxin system
VALAFICDVHITPRLVGLLRSKGFAADHAASVGLASAADDEIWQHAERHDAIIVTKDSDFLRLNASQPGPRVVLVRLGNCTNKEFLGKFEESLAQILEHFEAGSRLVELA